MVDADDVLNTVSNVSLMGVGCSIVVKQLLEPRQIRKVNEAIIKSLNDAKNSINSSANPSAIYTDHYFVCNPELSSILKLYGCTEGPQGIHQLINLMRVIEIGKIDISKIKDNVDEDTFFEIMERSKNISDDELRIAWNKILKNTIEDGHKYSKRTLRLLSDLSVSEAKLFDSHRKSIVNDGREYYLICEPNCSGIKLLNLADLVDSGFINPGELSISDGRMFWGDCIIEYKGPISIRKLTQFGIDIYSIMDKNITDEDYIRETKKIGNDCAWSLHRKTDNSHYITTPFISGGRK